MKYQPYRDEPFQRSCEDRYEVIKELASKYKRQFSVLDVGANHGWFGQQLVRDFDCVYVGIDNKVIDPHPRIWHINRHITPGELLCLSRCESFDIVLGLAVLHHMEDYEAAFHAINRLGHFAFFEICGPGDVNARAYERHEGIAKLFSGEPMATFESHVSDADRLWYLYATAPFISEQTLDAPNRGAPGYATYKISSSFDECNILIDRRPIKMEEEVRPFIPGMNLHNFHLLGGKADVPEDDGLSDYKPWNYIIGDGIHRIDTFHVKART
jgi:hypothetical protein